MKGTPVKSVQAAIHHMNPTAINKFASLVKHLRISMGLSQQAFADRVGLTQASLYAWEAGKIKTEPKAKYLRTIAQLKGWSFDELMRHLEGVPTIPDKASSTELQGLLKNLENLSQSQAREAVKILLPIAGFECLDTTGKGASIAFSRDAREMTFSQLLQRFLGCTPPDIVDAQLTKKRLTRNRLNELVEGNRPTDEDLRKLGAILGDVGFKDSRGEEYSIEQLERIAAGSSITNGTSSR